MVYCRDPADLEQALDIGDRKTQLRGPVTAIAGKAMDKNKGSHSLALVAASHDLTFGAGGGNRTRTPSRALDFELLAYTIFS
jgi:hypothetical protein